MVKIVLATGNEHKAEELRAILVPLLSNITADDIVTMRNFPVPDIIENGTTFEENALIKARVVAKETGHIALADDSGICVDIMGGMPGIFSARWSGTHGNDQENLQLLIAQMADVEPSHRRARFVCAAALATPEGAEEVCLGEMRGVILKSSSGEHGFGYDPIFQADGYDVSNACLSAEEKNAISHRYRAFHALASKIENYL